MPGLKIDEKDRKTEDFVYYTTRDAVCLVLSWEHGLTDLSSPVKARWSKGLFSQVTKQSQPSARSLLSMSHKFILLRFQSAKIWL